MKRTTITLAEAAMVTCLCFGLAIFLSTRAVLADFPVAQFSDSSNIWSICIELILATAAILYLRARGFDVVTLYPHPTLRGTFAGLGVFVLACLVGGLVAAPFARSQVPLTAEFSFAGSSLASTVLFAIVNGTFEEIFLLGVLVRGLRGYGLSIAVGVPLLVRVLYHLYQGPLGVVWILAFGLTFTLVYLRTQKLWPLVFAHILWDIVPVYAAAP